jgi:succinyl-diaminopimelate desuccinylase
MRPSVDADALIEFTQRLVRIRSVNDPEAGSTEADAAMEVADLMRAWGWEPLIEEVAPGRLNVISVLAGNSPGRTLLLEGHTDVVTEGDLREWSFDPYGGQLVDGKLYGRGAADMKGGLAAMLFAARAIQSSGPFPGTIVVAALCDEEEMMIGAKHFARSELAATIDGAFICEPEEDEVCTTQKGAIRIRVEATGKMAHGAMPHQGKNPILGLMRFQAELASLETELQSRHGSHPDLGLPYVTPTTIRAGSIAQMNVIPRDAVMTVDLRTLPGIDHEQLIAHIEDLAGPVMSETGVHLEFEVLDNRPPTEVAKDHPVVRAIVEGHREVVGEDPPFGGVPGTTDGTILWRDAGIPVVVYGPGGKWIAHQADEYVEVEDVITKANVYVAATLRFLAS